MASIYELLGVLVFSFALNLIPFASPSNFFIASNAALLVESDPLMLGFLVALGSVCAKGIHYIITFFVSKHLSEKRRQRLDAGAVKIKRWAFLLLFVSAATPIPDEPVVIPLGLLKYNPAKFFVAFFLGKLSITIFGAYLGNWSEGLLSSVISQEIFIVISIVLTILITILLLKVDLGNVMKKILKRKTDVTGTF
jgi:membrane protein YqaA with SNARE-associated domain